MKLDKLDTAVFGSCKKVRINDKQTTIIDGYGDEQQIVDRIEEIKSQLDTAQSAYDREKVQTRLAKLAGGVAVLKIGAQSEVELKEKKDRVEDALHATRAAVKEGIVPGGGIALLNASYVIDTFSLGEEILLDSIRAPFKTILDNAGIDYAPLETISKVGYGLNVITGETVDMIKEGIIDPLLVTKSALNNAISVATTILSTDCVISNVRE